MRLKAIIATVLVSFIFACDEQFQPKGIFESKLVVYSTLTSGSDSVFVRVHTTYDPPAFNPLEHTTENSVAGATVTLTGDTSLTVLRDTTIAHPDSGRYGQTMSLFYGSPVSFVRGRSYTLTVSVPGYPVATARTTVPGVPDTRIVNAGLLATPRVFDTQDIGIILISPGETKGFLLRLFVEYELELPVPHRERMEVPSDYTISRGTFSPIYPRMTLVEGFGPGQLASASSYRFNGRAYRHVIETIRSITGSGNVEFRQVILYVYMAEEHLYNYSHVVNGFFDEFTIRTDVPDYTNIQGGVGLFGAFTLDSLNIPLPDVLNP